METLSVLTWNMNQRPEAWQRLAQLRDKFGVQVALVQEAVPPPGAGWRVHPQPRHLGLGGSSPTRTASESLRPLWSCSTTR